MTPTPTPSRLSSSHFPAHSEPRVWFITSAASPVGIATAREVLAQGDIVIAGDDTVIQSEQDPTRIAELAALNEDAETWGWQDRLRVIKLVSRCEAPIPVSAYRWGQLMSLCWQKMSESLPSCHSRSPGGFWEDRYPFLQLQRRYCNLTSSVEVAVEESSRLI